MGGFFAGLVGGLGQAAHEKHLLDVENERQRRENLARTYEQLANHPGMRPEAVQDFAMRGLQIRDTPYNKKIPKELENPMDIFQKQYAPVGGGGGPLPSGQQQAEGAAPAGQNPGVTAAQGATLAPTAAAPIPAPPGVGALYTPQERLHMDLARIEAASRQQHDIEQQFAAERRQRIQNTPGFEKLSPRQQMEALNPEIKVNPEFRPTSIPGTVPGSAIQGENDVFGHPVDPSQMYRATRNPDGSETYYPTLNPAVNGDIVPDSTFKTGYARILRDRQGREIKREEALPPAGFVPQTSTSNTTQTVVVGDKVVQLPKTTTTTRSRQAPGTTPSGGSTRPVPIPAPPSSGGGAPATTAAPGGMNLPRGARVLGPSGPAATREAETTILTEPGKKQLTEVGTVATQFDSLLDKLEPYKTDNNPLTMVVPLGKYKLGLKSPEGELGNEISNLSLGSIQGMMPFASKSRNYQYIRDIAQHLPKLVATNPDSPAQMYDKLLKARRNFERMKATTLRYETKRSTGTAEKPYLPDEELAVYHRMAMNDPAALKNPNLVPSIMKRMATEDGWSIEK